MSWNEPDNRDDRGKKRDPWGRQDEDAPPNIDEALRQLQQKLRGLFGMGQGGGSSSSFMPKSSPSTPRWSWGVFGGIALVIYGLSGIYIVQPAEEAVVLRFGQFKRTEGSGLHWIAPLIESKKVVNVQEVKTAEHGGPMLTKDENLVSAIIAVQYRIQNAPDYLFNVVDPEQTLRQVSESALRSVVGESTLNEVLTIGRSDIGAKIRKQVQQNLNNYGTGIEISDLAMQQTKAPEEVKAAFDDAIRAQQDEERSVNQAEAYSRKIIPIAEGQAKRTLEEAKAYREKMIMQAEGKTAKFAQVLPEYRKAPQVTRDRMYMDTLQEVYTKTPKVVVDVGAGNNLIYLPIDQLLQSKRSAQADKTVKDEEPLSPPVMESSPAAITSVPRRLSARPDYEDPERLTTRGGE